MANPKISVIMSVYNGEKYLRESIESILSQTFSDFEFIIVDDSSTDRSVETIQGYGDDRIKVTTNEKNIGLTKSLNKALAQARGDYIARQDADDISLPNRLEEQVKYFKKYPGVALLGTSIYRIDEDGRILGKMVATASPGKILFKENQFSHGTVMFRREVIDKLGGYDESFRCAQDYELWLRIAKHYEVRILTQILYKLRFHNRAVSMNKIREVQKSTFRIKVRYLPHFFSLLNFIYTIRSLCGCSLPSFLLRRIARKNVRI